MKNDACRIIYCVILFTFLFSGFAVNAQQSTIIGTVFDETNDPLPYASVTVEGTTIGTSADINGKFVLNGVPIGSQTIRFSFLGYQTKLVPVTIDEGKAIDLNTNLDPIAIQGKEVVITGQVRGQAQAINQQLNAPGIVNVVSQDKIKELPDTNAADAAGRLPGIMVQRSGGEGEKLIIRGLDPKYSTVSVNGVVAPASSATDRSTNMNLISPDIISGIEVSKANTADQDADGMGGTVNMLVKEADANRRLNVISQGGYSGQLQEISNYKAALFFSDRFFGKKLGMMLSGNIESYDRSSDRLKTDYEVTRDPVQGEKYVQPEITKLRLRSTLERRERYNASAIFDFRFNSKHTLKMVNMYSQTDKDVFDRNKSFAMDNGQLRFEQAMSNPTSFMISNAFDGKHILGNTELVWAVSRSETKSRTPNEHTFEFRHTAGINIPTEVALLNPLDVPNPENINEDIKVYNLYQGIIMRTQNKETEWGAKLDYKIPFNFFDRQFSGYIKLGAKMRIKDRERNSFRWFRRLDAKAGLDAMRNRDDYEASSSGGLGIMSFLDPNFKTPHFLNGMGKYITINYALDRKKVHDFFLINNPNPLVVPDPAIGDQTSNLYQYVPTAKIKDDYTGHEELWAGYLMGEFNIGKMITFIPGLRFDHQYVRYMAYKGNDIPDSYDANNLVVEYEPNYGSSEQLFILPQIHLKVKPLSWFDVRLAYTQTLSRPDYHYLAPRTQISVSQSKVVYTTPHLNSARSENFDIILSFYQSKYGLFTAGAFQKNISDFLYERSALLTVGSSNTDPGMFGLDDRYRSYTITYPRNNPEKSTIKGLEFEGQTNFRWAPQPLTGLVLSGNVTFMNSTSSYQATLIERRENPNYGKPDPVTGIIDRQRTILVNKDTAYVDRLLNQPSLLGNISVGYDIKGFSARISYAYQANILTKEQRRPDGSDKEITTAFSRWDLQLKQKIRKNISLYFNMTNIFNTPDKSIRDVTGYYTAIEYYGMGINLGVKIDIF